MDNEKICSFCEELKLSRYIASHRRSKQKYAEKYTASFEMEEYCNGECTGSIKHCGYELNFCPECGKALSDSK